jgi:nicotinate-nucleotide adenylyltransferase
VNIAIFGGSFDPPHIGHEAIVNRSLEVLDIDKLFVIPAFLPPFKQKYHFSPKDRFNLSKQLFKNKQVEVLDYEIKQNNPTPTINTVKHIISTINPNNIYLIIGADNLSSIHLWQDFEQLKDLVSFIVISRDQKSLKNDIIQFKIINIDIKISSTELRQSRNLNFIPKKIQKKVQELWKID